MSRIEPLTPPYPADVDRALRRWMPPGVPHEPLALFRVLHRNPELASRMFASVPVCWAMGSSPPSTGRSSSPA